MSEKIKAAALSATKGLSRVQAERAAANATRNVNAYGQKEEGPSRWQEKKAARTEMYLKSTEKQATLNVKRCQKCHQPGHWTYECQKQVPEKPKFDGIDMKKEEKAEKGLKKEEKSSKRRNKKRKDRYRSSSETSDSDSDSEERRKKRRRGRSSSESSDSDSGNKEGGSRRRRKKKRHSRRPNGGR